LLKEDLANDPKTVVDIEIIEKQANNCQRIVNDLLHFSHAGHPDKSFSSVNECVLTVVDMFKHQFDKNQVHISTDMQDDLPLLNMDQEKMKQVLVNIVTNAVQAINEDGAVQIATRYHRNRGLVTISIEDNGTGMDPEMISKVFEPFYTTKKPGQGTGLGLSLSLGIVEEHGGDIQLESAPGSGTKFTILLPVDNENTMVRG
jgi:signal transduction histidine kinase